MSKATQTPEEKKCMKVQGMYKPRRFGQPQLDPVLIAEAPRGIATPPWMGCSSTQGYKKPQQLKRDPKIRGE